jgi:hypothetical protein
MYSVTNRSSYEHASGYLDMIHRVKDVTRANAPPIIVLGNKIDLLNAKGDYNERVVSPAEVRTFHTSLSLARSLAGLAGH